MLKIKSGVEPYRLLIMVAAVGNVAQTLLYPTNVVITSGIDGVHREGSKHYSLHAIDVRTNNFPTAKSKLIFQDLVKTRLGADYDVVLEPDHLHIEYDPKG